MTGSLLLASLLKGEQSVLLQWRGSGPLGAVVAEARANRAVRGYVSHPNRDLPLRDGKIDVGGGVGAEGQLVVVKDLGLKEPYVSTVPLQTGEMGDDLAYYLLCSEQIPSAVALGVHLIPDYSVASAGGVLVESLPGADEAEVDRVAENLGRMGSVTEVVRAGSGAEGLVARSLEGIAYHTRPLGMPRYSCACSPERLDATLAALGPDEVVSIIANEGEVRARCAFCATEWRKRSLEGEWERQTGAG